MTPPTFISVIEDAGKNNRTISVFGRSFALSGEILQVGYDFVKISNPKDPKKFNVIPFDRIETVSIGETY